MQPHLLTTTAAVATATLLLLGLPVSATGQAIDPLDPTWIAEFDNAIVAGTVTPPGNELEDLQTDLKLYDELAYTYEEVTAENLTVDYFKDGRWLPITNPSRTYRPRADVTVVRTQQGVPNIFGETDAALGFGAGFVTAEDRLPTLIALRALGRAEAFELMANNETWLMDAELVRLYGYTEAEFQAQLDRLPAIHGTIGQELVDLVSAFAAGINHFMLQAQSGRVPMPGSLADVLGDNTIAPFSPTDIVAIVAIVRALFGADGGRELASAARWLELQETYGEEAGRLVYEDFRNRRNADGPLHTIDESFSFMIPAVPGPTEGNAMTFDPGASGIEGLLREVGSIVPGTDGLRERTTGEMAANLRALEEASRIKW